AVAHVVPPELAPPGGDPDLKIDVIPSGQPASVPLRSEVVTDARRPLWWVVPVGVAAGGLLVLVPVVVVVVLAGLVPAGRGGGGPGLAATPPGPGTESAAPASEPSPLRKAAILLVSLEQPLASQLLAQLDRAAVEAVTLEIAQLDRIDPVEQQSVLEEFYGLG